MTAYQIR